MPDHVTFPALDEDDARHWRLSLAVLALASALRLALGAALPLFEDEAYYWVWSRRLAPGYFDHPPMIAVLIRVGTALLGDTPVGVRVFPILAGSSAALGAMLVARRLGDARAAVRAAVVFTVMPLAAAGLVLATPDAPLLAAVAWTLYAMVRALQAAPRSSATLGWWLCAGAVLGLGLQAKYTAILVPAGLGLAALAHAKLRPRLAEPGPWLAVAVASLVFTPVVLWNARHEWVSFAFQVQHGLGPRRGAAIDALQRVGDLLAGQAALASPILFVLMAFAVARAISPRGDPMRFMLAVLAVIPLAVFGYSATRRSIEANWPALLYVPAALLLVTSRRPSPFSPPLQATERGTGGEDRPTLLDRLFRWGVGLAAAMSAVIYVHAVVPIVPLRPDRDPIADAFGWEALADSSIASAPSTPCPGHGRRTWFAGNRYQDAAELAFQLRRRKESRCAQALALNVMSRANQYDLWPGIEDVLGRGDDLVLVLSGQPGDTAIVAEVAERFETVRPGPLVSLARSGAEHDRRRIWVFEEWRDR